jgi:hypothetical protein
MTSTTEMQSAPPPMRMSRVFELEPHAWAVRYARVLHPLGTRRFLPYPYQESILRDGSPRRLILKARQTGISQTVAVEARHAADYQPGSTTLFLSRTEKMASDLIRYARAAAPVTDANRITRDNSLALEFGNGSRIIAEAATKSAGRGFAATSVYLDEFAFHEYDAEVWRAIQPTVSTGGRITVLSTPNGRANVFYLMWSGEYGEWSKHLVHWRDCPAYDDDWYARTRPGFTTRDWASEYECDFVESGGAAFPADLCERAYDRRLPNDDPRTWVPTAGSTTYWDLGARQDATVGVTVANVGGKLPVVAFLRMEAPNEWPAIERAIASRIAAYPDGRHIIESNGIGDPFIAKCREDGLPVEEFMVTARSKGDMLRALVLSMEQDRFRHGSQALYAEQLRYEYADAKITQDCVMAAAGAVYAADKGGVLLFV